MICVCVPEVYGTLINPHANSHITSMALKTQKNVLRKDITGVGGGAGRGGGREDSSARAQQCKVVLSPWVVVATAGSLTASLINLWHQCGWWASPTPSSALSLAV